MVVLRDPMYLSSYVVNKEDYYLVASL